MKVSGSVYIAIQRGFCSLFLIPIILALCALASAGNGQLVVSPSSINFGVVSVGSTSRQSFTLANSGGPKITITQVSLSGTGFTLSGLGFPITLAGGQSVTGTVTFTPTSVVADNGSASFLVASQGPGGKRNNSSTASTIVMPMSGTGTSSVSLTISPASASTNTGGQQQFSASVSGSANTAVSWSASGGTVTSGGLFTAPSNAGTYIVTATSMADATKSASAAVTVSQPIQISVSVAPGSANLQTGGQQQFSASVSGTANTAVSWSASGGTVTSGGLYTAPSNAGTYIVTATSMADATKSASATVTVVQPVQISVSVAPGSASLQTGAQQQFTASVSGTSNTTVTWAASGGTVSSSGLYTAPGTAGTYTVMATSAADPTKSASATVAVSQAIAVSVSPNSASIQASAQQQFTAYVSGTSNTAVNWSASAGTINNAGLYTAPASAGSYVITATSAADPTKSASASVVVAAAQNVAVTVSPTSTTMPAAWQQQFAATVSGSSNTAVTWTVAQGSGTITQTGLYTAPTVAETDIVMVRSQADTTKFANATITVAAPHSVSLTWSPSTSSGISYYKVYRASASGGPYSLLRSGVPSTSYTDSSVQSGSSYYYVATAVDSTGAESAYSDQAAVVIPMP